MNVVHCNDCGGTDDVSKIEVIVEKIVPLTEGNGVGLAKNDRQKIEGDLCADCLKVVTDMVTEKDDLLVTAPRRPDYSEVT